jgi:hypothetical protein
VPNNFEPFEAVDSLLTPSYHSEHTTPADPLPQLPSNYVQNTFPPTSEPRDIQDQPGLGQERWSQEPQWEFSEEQFIQSRLGIYDPPSSQAQEPRWEFAEEPFIQSRLSIYDPRGSQAQEPQWEFAEEPFIQSRLDVNDMQSAQKSISFGG